MRSFLVLVVVGTVGLLAGCGSSNNTPTPVGVPVTIALSPANATLSAGKAVNITLSTDSSGKGVTWSISPVGVGTLSNQTKTSATYTAPNPVASDSLVTVIATSVADPTTSTSLHIPVLPTGAASNVHPISINGGPLAPNSIYVNGAFTSVTICAPSTPNCQTIDNILVDTGSFGLRILASQITIPLPTLTDSTGNTLNNCIQFLDHSFLWGNVAQADIVMAGEVASATSVQSIATPTSYSIPLACSTNGTGINEDTQATLGANGILGVGQEPFDCGTACDPNTGGVPPEPTYYLCSSSAGCAPTFVSCGALCGDSQSNQQLTNAVLNFPLDNNGVILELPAVSGAAATVDGSMIFGIGTQSNNHLGSATVLTLDSSDNFATLFSGQNLTASFIDSGSNGLFFPNGIEVGFPSNTIPTCASPEQAFFCPASLANFSATNQSSLVNFSVDNATNLFSQNPADAAFSTLGGSLGSGGCTGGNGACTFDWGLPFFYGRNVFTAINGATAPAGVPAGPFYAY